MRFTELSIDHNSPDSPELKSLQDGLGAITAFQELMIALTEEMMRLHRSQELDVESKMQIEKALNFQGILFSMHATQQRNILSADMS